MTYIAKQDFLWYKRGDEVNEKEADANDWVAKQLVEIVNGSAKSVEFKDMKAAEQKAWLEEQGVEPASKQEDRIAQYEEIVGED